MRGIRRSSNKLHEEGEKGAVAVSVEPPASRFLGDFLTFAPAFLQRIYVPFFISLATRRIEYVACTPNPDGGWVAQQARNLIMRSVRSSRTGSRPRPRHEVLPRLRRGLPD